MTRLRQKLKNAAGSLCEVVLPGVARDLDQGLHTGRHIRIKNWILSARAARAIQRGDNQGAQSALIEFWRNDTANGFYDQYALRFRTWFLEDHQDIIRELKKYCDKHPFRQMIELGCGDGRVLQHCAGIFIDTDRFIGIDINPAIIQRNIETYAGNEKLHFTSGDAIEWLQVNPVDGCLIFSYGGVLEYFSPEALCELFELVANQAQTTIAFVEPVDPGHDLHTAPDSYTFGSENSFSHNHTHLLTKSGFKVVYARELELGKVRWMMVIAKNGD